MIGEHRDIGILAGTIATSDWANERPRVPGGLFRLKDMHLPSMLAFSSLHLRLRRTKDDDPRNASGLSYLLESPLSLPLQAVLLSQTKQCPIVNGEACYPYLAFSGGEGLSTMTSTKPNR